MKCIFSNTNITITFLVVILVGCKQKVSFSKESIWSVGIVMGKSPFNMHPVDSIKNPVLSASDVNDVNAAFIADPFLWQHDSLWYMFFEVLNKKDMRGDIGYAMSKNCKDWKYKKIILDCKTHCSYPYVFEDKNRMYMLPENAESGYLILYESKNFPEQWEAVDTLLTGNYGDNSIFRYKDTWWLMVCSEPTKNNVLKLFYSDSLNGKWIEHPSSPIVARNAGIARPAGRILILNDSIIRFAQDCKSTYGKAVNAFLITSLNKSQYVEIPALPVPIVKNGMYQWAQHGMHQFDVHKIDDSTWIASVDGYKKRMLLSVDY